MAHPEPSRHPSRELLAIHAAGQNDRAQRVLVEAHLGLCPACRRSLAEDLEPGGRWLDQQPEEMPPEAVWQRLAACLDGPPDPSSEALAEAPLPEEARQELAGDGAALRWRRVPFSSVRYLTLLVDRERQVSLQLLRMPGDRRLPRHEHLGPEDLVVLAGGYTDAFGHFAAGDYQVYPAGSEHEPRSDRVAEGWALVRVEKGLRFRGWVGLLQRLAGLLRRGS